MRSESQIQTILEIRNGVEVMLVQETGLKTRISNISFDNIQNT